MAGANPLTEKQLRFLRLTAQGLTAKQIARVREDNDVHAVRKTLKRASKRLGAKTPAQAVAIAIARNYLLVSANGEVESVPTKFLDEAEELGYALIRAGVDSRREAIREALAKVEAEEIQSALQLAGAFSEAGS